MIQRSAVATDQPLLPEDPATLQRRLLEAQAEIMRLQMLIAGFLRHRFGCRSEQLSDEALDQGIEDLEQSLAEQTAKIEAAQPVARVAPPKRNRGALPADLSRVEVVVDVADKTCPCCGAPLHAIGEDRAEMLDHMPAQFLQIIRYALRLPGPRAGRGAGARAGAPDRWRHGDRGAAGACAGQQICRPPAALSPGADLPLVWHSTRCARGTLVSLARQGVTLDRSTLCNWVGRACWWLEPLHALILSTVLSSPKVVADNTTMPVLDPGRGRTKTGRLWCYATDNRPWSGPSHPAAAYVYSEDRKGEHPTAHLKGLQGLLQVDGYAGFNQVQARTNQPPLLAFCWAHARRKFYDVHIATKSPIAHEALQRIAELYAVESDISGRPAEYRQGERQQRRRPLVEALQSWLREQLDRLSGRSKLAQAICYTFNHWEGLIRFLDDGRLEMDTNIVERAMRPIALGRKNALFAGADSGGRHWSIIATLIQSAKLNGVEPLAWLADVLKRIVSGQTKRHELDKLLPWNWKLPNEPEPNSSA